MNSQIIFDYFPDLTQLQKERFEALSPLYMEWNEKINVVSRKDIENLYLHHVLHSLAIARFISFKKGCTIIDVGTGGGFPGIPLAILFPETRITLCDSIAKKITVASEIARSLSLTNVIPFCGRAETIPSRYDYVVSRAVSQLTHFLPLVDRLYDRGVICLKGGDTDREIKESGIKLERFQTINISDWFEDDFFQEKKIVFLKR